MFCENDQRPEFWIILGRKMDSDAYIYIFLKVSPLSI